MRVKKISFLAIILIFCVQNLSLAASIEITTGSKSNEGIKASSGRWLKNGSLVQFIRTGSGVPCPPDREGNPSSPDELISETEIGYNFPFTRDQGKFDFQVWAGGEEKIYVRAWDGKERYGDSEVYTVEGINGEIWNIGGEENKPAFRTEKKVSKVK